MKFTLIATALALLSSTASASVDFSALVPGDRKLAEMRAGNQHLRHLDSDSTCDRDTPSIEGECKTTRQCQDELYPGLDAIDCKRSDFGDSDVGECFCGERSSPVLCGCIDVSSYPNPGDGTDDLDCSDTGAWLFPQEVDGSIIIPRGCACPNFPVRLVLGDTACVTRLEDKGQVVEATPSEFCFPNNIPLSPANINFDVASEAPEGPDDTVTIKRGPGGFIAFFNTDRNDAVDVPKPDFGTVPFFLNTAACECVVAFIGTQECYTDGTFTEPCDCAECGAAFAVGVSRVKAVADDSLNNDACVDLCAQVE